MPEKLKYMFDRDFDTPFYDTNTTETPDYSEVSVDGIPSISQLLNTLNSKSGMDILSENEEEISTKPEGGDEEDGEYDLDSSNPADENDVLGLGDIAAPDDEPVEKHYDGISPEELEKQLDQVRKETREAVEKEVSEIAYQKGFEVGLEEGKGAGQSQAWSEALDTIQQKTNDLLEAMNGHLEKLEPLAEKLAQDCFDSTMEMSLAVVKKILPSMTAEATEEIRQLLEQNFHFLVKEPKIIVKIHPDMAESVKEKLADLAKKNSFSGKISINKDESLPKTDCHVEWEYGGLSRSVQSLLDETEELLKTYKQGK